MNIAEIHDDSPGRSYGRDVTQYVLAGERVPSVTEVTNLAGLSDIRKVIALAGEEVVASAARRGSLVHGFCEMVDRDPEFDPRSLPESIRGYVLAYVRFVREFAFVPDLIEEPMVSATYRFAGTVDRVGKLGPEPFTIDIKTPASASPSWRIQTAAYAILAEENYGIRTKRACLRLRNDGSFKLDPYPDPTGSDARVFLSALSVVHYRLAHGLASLEE